MKILILGGTGLLGSKLKDYCDLYGFSCSTVARKNSTFNIDLLADDALMHIFDAEKPTHVINTFALTNLTFCEENEHHAKKAHIDIVHNLSLLSAEIGFKFIHISTDQVYDNSFDIGSKESDPLSFKNIYVKTKIEGEKHVLSDGLILRTAFLGKRLVGPMSLSDYYFSVIEQNLKAKIFNDVYSSALDVSTLCEIILRSIQEDLCGVYNVGTSSPYLKSELFDRLCANLNLRLDNIEYGPCNLVPIRNKNCGLNCDKIRTALNLKLPTLDQVCEKLIREARDGLCT